MNYVFFPTCTSPTLSALFIICAMHIYCISSSVSATTNYVCPLRNCSKRLLGGFRMISRNQIKLNNEAVYEPLS